MSAVDVRNSDRLVLSTRFALLAGAKGYVLKDSAENDLIETIKAVSKGRAFFSPEISRILVQVYVREMRKRGAEGSYELLTSRSGGRTNVRV